MLERRRVLVTGGAGGLGWELALRIARAGWRACVADADDASGAEVAAALGPGAEYLRCDVTREEDLPAAARRLEERWGGVAAVVSLSGTLQNELAGDGIAVTLVCPGFFKSGLAGSLPRPEPGLRAAMEGLFDRSPVGAAEIADQVFRAVERGDFYVLPHPAGRRAWLLKRLLPRRLYLAASAGQRRRLRRHFTRARAGGAPP